jgi:dihydrofolate reductase
LITLILARARNGVIGRDNRLPWHLPADLKRFKALTMGKPMVMGRKTFEGFPAPLPGRRHIVLTRDAAWRAEGAEVVADADAALALAGDVPEIAVIGGAQVFALFLGRADRVELTEVHLDAVGDAVVPPLGPDWREVARVSNAAADGRPAFDYVTLARDPPPPAA